VKRSYSKVSLFIRSLIVFLYACTFIFLYSFVCVAAFVLPLRYRHALIRSYIYSYFYLLKKICHLDYQVEGLENIPKNSNGIVFCKHQSAWETLFLPLIFHNPAIIAKRELLWVPFFGWGLASSGPIAIDRSKQVTAMQQIIQQGKKKLDEGRWVIIFPEGTRIPYGKIGKYRLGGGRLAHATGYPVIPVAHNAGKFWPKRQFIKRPGTIRVVIGPIIESKDKTAEEIVEAAKSWIEETVKKIDLKSDQ
jgi:1-acyl-sn-glycerol-3-phosphate acyltransferase